MMKKKLFGMIAAAMMMAGVSAFAAWTAGI